MYSQPLLEGDNTLWWVNHPRDQQAFNTRGAHVGWNGHVWAETQEVTFVGLLILATVWYRAHTADWKQGLK